MWQNSGSYIDQNKTHDICAQISFAPLWNISKGQRWRTVQKSGGASGVVGIICTLVGIGLTDESDVPLSPPFRRPLLYFLRRPQKFENCITVSTVANSFLVFLKI